VAGHAELADDENVERNVERAGDLGRNRDATTGKAEHYDVGAVSEVAEFGGEQAARFGTVAKTPLGGQWSRLASVAVLPSFPAIPATQSRRPERVANRRRYR